MTRPARILIASLATPAVAAFAIFAVSSADGADFGIVVTPNSQTAVRGATVMSGVSLIRAGSFTGAIKLRVTGLPPGVRADWQLADGTGSDLVPSTERSAILVLKVAAGAALGSRRLRVLASGGGITRVRTLTLTVERRRFRGFSLRIGPSRQVVPQGASATYDVRVARAAGFRRPVMLRVLRLPRGAKATWAPNALTVATSTNQRLGTEALVVRGTSVVGGRFVRRYAAVMLTVLKSRRFSISGDVSTLMYPGRTSPLDLVLSNPYPFDLRVRTLRVQVRAGTSDPQCSGTANYAVTQYTGGYPLTLRAGSARLSTLVPDASAWPQVAMHNLPTNQDACKNARLTLDYDGLATR